MKRIYKLFLAVALIIASTSLSANAQIYYGVKAGANISTASASSDLGSTKSDYGYQVGGVLGAKIPIIGIGIEAEALWVNNKLSFSNGFDITSNTFEVPVMASIPLLPALPIYLKAGPNFILHSNAKVEAGDSSYDIDPVKGGVGYTIGLGVKLLKVTLDVRYNGQFSSTSPLGSLAGDLTTAATSTWDIMTSTFSATLGYRF